jgi:carboxyl-terminal processing protease
MDLSNGGALDLTIGEYFTAHGVSLAGVGIKPDVRALDDPKTKPDEALQRAYGVLSGAIASPGRSPQAAGG